MTFQEDLGIDSSEEMAGYFRTMRDDCMKELEIAKEARLLGYDPETEVSVTLARTLAERVIGLISVIAPQIKGAGVEQRIEELEKQYGTLDWRVALTISHEISESKYCAFKDELEAITIGVRVGFAYLTLGVVSAPLEGITHIEIKDRLDRQGKYFCLHFAGPIRNAGGTAAAVCVILADYVRVKKGYATYDPTDKEVQRCPAELADYHKYVTNLQYMPSEEESVFLMRHIPVEVSGDASETFEISNAALKDLPRIPTNQLRSGYCLIHSSCIPLKAPKLWKSLSKWGDSFDLGHWSFMKEFLDIQKKMKAAGKQSSASDVKITPDYTYIKDLVAGRPVLAYPLAHGGLRLRYGRSRASGYSGQAIHPATMHVLNDYIASATQLKVERPGKAAAFMPCDSIDGPIVRLDDGTVLHLHTDAEARAVKTRVQRILYLGDVLINYGDFFDRNHALVPAGYCPEWWVQEVEVALGGEQPSAANPSAEEFASKTGLPLEKARRIMADPMRVFPTAEEALSIARGTGTPLHTAWTPYWTGVNAAQLVELVKAITSSRVLHTEGAKEALELLGIPHAPRIVDGERRLVLEEGWLLALVTTLGLAQEGAAEDIQTLLERDPSMDVLAFIKGRSPFAVRDKAGTFIGARMGRPEKAKMRKLTGSPHGLFPVGAEGGRLRSIQEALHRGKISAEYPLRNCPTCQKRRIFARCEVCDTPTTGETKTIERYGKEIQVTSMTQDLPIREVFDGCLKKLGFTIYPDLIKGVRGTSNKSHIPEHLIKSILRAKHDIAVNKDGTTRYDSSEVTLTHFRPREVGTSVERLLELGYTHDVKGVPLTMDDQVLELRPQDIVIPCCPDSPDEPADQVLYRITKFIDELLERLYGLPAYYRLQTPSDLVGHYVVGLAPHTSAGIVGRIIGRSKTQGFLAHPLYHAAMRRDCDGDESCFILLMDVFLNFSSHFLSESRGSTMDAPLVVTYLLDPAGVDDMAFHVDRSWKYPLALYNAALEYKKPYDITIDLLKEHVGKPSQFEGMGYTHDSVDINQGITCSAYKTLPSMQEKLTGQMDLAVRIRACDASDVARLVIEKHFIRDTKGNLRKFTQQEWRCVNCNEKFRRPPLTGRCTACKGKILFTISEGSVIKYLGPSISLAEKYNVPAYLKQDLMLLQKRVDDLFGKDAETQLGLGKWFG